MDFGVLESMLQDPCAVPMCLPMDFLKAITQDFSQEREVGRGGYGVVYKVMLLSFFTALFLILIALKNTPRSMRTSLYRAGLRVVVYVGIFCGERKILFEWLINPANKTSE